MFESGLKPDPITYVMNPGREGPHVGSIETAGGSYHRDWIENGAKANNNNYNC